MRSPPTQPHTGERLSPSWQNYLPPIEWWLLAALLGLCGLALRGTELNVLIFHWFNDRAPDWAAAASWGSVLGLGAVPLIVAAAGGPRAATAVAAVLLALIVCGALVQLLKFAVGEARPLAVLGANAMHVVGAALRGRAMPSGHAAAGACAATMVWAAAALNRRLILGAFLLSVLAVLEAFARMVVGAHWPSDVLAGAGLGVLAGALVYGSPIARRACDGVARWLRGRIGSRLLAVALVVTAVSLWRGRGDYPLAFALYLALALLALGAALRWLLPHARRGARAGADEGRQDMLGAP